jgi:hypothetical protein
MSTDGSRNQDDDPDANQGPREYRQALRPVRSSGRKDEHPYNEQDKDG